MIVEPTQRAALVPLDGSGQRVEAEKVEFDFNPETLTVRVNASLSSTSARGRAEHEAPARATGTLSFDAVFDGTRPRSAPSTAPRAGGLGLGASVGVRGSLDADGIVSVTAGASASFSAGVSASVNHGLAETPPPTGDAASPDALDVRQRTGRISAWLVGNPSDSHPQPRQVSFEWGRIIYRGVIESFSETIDFFAPDGTALRSKVSVSIREAAQSNRVIASERQSQALQGGFDAGASASFNFSASTGFGLSGGLSGGLSASLGAGVNLAASAGAGVAISGDLAVGVFGGAAVGAALGASVDGSAAAVSRAAAVSQGNAPATPTSWASAGPAAGTAAAASAALVNRARAAGGASSLPDPAEGNFTATRLSRSAPGAIPGAALARAATTVTPLPVRGSPPRRYPVSAEPRPVARAHDVPVGGERSRTRPAWETTPAQAQGATDRTAPCSCKGVHRCR